MHCACLVSRDKPDQICGRTIVDWFPSSNANLELPKTCMFCIDGYDWLIVLLGRNADSRKSNYSVYGQLNHMCINDLSTRLSIQLATAKNNSLST